MPHSRSKTLAPDSAPSVGAFDWQPWLGNSDSCRQLLDSIGDGFLALDHGGRVLLANQSALRLLRLTQEEILGCALADLVPGLSMEELTGGLAGDALPLMMTPGRTNGSEAASDARQVLIPVRLQGEVRQFEFSPHVEAQGVGLLFRDVSEWIRHEMEIAKLNATMAASQELLRSKNEELNASLEQLARMNEQLTKADQLKGEFLANTSHELRTPLNSIIGFLQLIDEGLCEDQAERESYLRHALDSARHLLSLINDLLDITKIEAGKMTFLIENYEVEDIFQEVYGLTQVQARQKNLTLEMDLPEGPMRVHADQHKCLQALVNLIGNSIKFTDEGGVRVWAEADPEHTDMVRFTVSDTGIGVPRHEQVAVFEKFKQADGTSTRKYQGTGLGLAITKNLVEMMGGSVWLESGGIGFGTAVMFTLPRALEMPLMESLDEIESSDIDERLPDTF